MQMLCVKFVLNNNNNNLHKGSAVVLSASRLPALWCRSDFCQ